MAKSADYFVRQIATEPKDGKPVKYESYKLPRVFTSTFYLIEPGANKVTQANYKGFDVWSVELTLHVMPNNFVDVVAINTKGSRPHTGHTITFGDVKERSLTDYGALTPAHFNYLASARPRFIQYAITSAIQSLEYKGGSSWSLGSVVDIAESELQAVAKRVRAYTKTKNGSYYEELAKRYKELVRDGYTNPIVKLKQTYYKEREVKTIQGDITYARKLGLIPPAEPGKNSKVRKTRKATK